ncbi:XRE family transcriptional regulator [Apilactobacillus quenuiae]|uniref:XRE family transcriptional regulator n=1 Tax=Apilactobacillus quenuiae TaxID=2008377 RepID=UPI000D020E8E|nr:XRE family transcriptional regulator [Apilactobacillus quenuiae]
MSDFNGQRLKEARYFNSLTITELANKLNVTKQMVSKYENNKSRPSNLVLFNLVKVLKFPNEFFFQKDSFSENSSGTFYRSKLTSTQKQKLPSHMIVKSISVYADYLSKYVDFPKLDRINVDINNDYIDYEHFSFMLRKHWKLNQNPINNFMDLLETHGFINAVLPKSMDKVDAFSNYENINDYIYYIIVTKKYTSFYRQQFSLAHELGHWLLHSDDTDPESLDNEEYRDKEKQANKFASAFLLPRNGFINSVKDLKYINLDSIIRLKAYWNVSMAAIIYRMYSLNLINTKDYLKLQRSMSYKGYRKIEPLDNDKPISSPTSLKYATELLVDNNILNPIQIPYEIKQFYNFSLLPSLWERLINLKKGYLSNESKNVITINDKYKG